MKKLSLLFAIICSVILIVSCDKGIEPSEPNLPGGFSGTVTFIGTWPSDIKRTHIVVFKNPLITADDFSIENFAFIVDTISYNSTEFIYNSFDDNYLEDIITLYPGNYKYVVVAQSKTPEISFQRNDWTVVGVYCNNNDQTSPASLIIQSNRITPDVNIVVDFNNPPPQPPM